MQSGPIWEVKIAIISFSMTRSCSLQKLLADLGVNANVNTAVISIILILTVLKLDL